MKVILKPKEFAVIKAKASGKTPVFQENHPLAHNADFQRKILLKQKRYSFFQGNFPAGRVADFQGKILLKQKRYSFFQGNFPAGRYASFDMLKKMKKFIHKL